MLTYSIPESMSECLYEYLYKCIKNDIVSGVIPANSKLPSKRSFALNSGVSTITVENAYGQLMAEGYIYSVPKKGFYAADIDKLQGKIKNKEIVEKMQDEKQYSADFVCNHTDADNFPFNIWTKLMRTVMLDNRNELMQNPPAAGAYILRKAIAEYLHEFRGMTVSPEQIVVGAGTEYLYGIIIQLFGSDKHYAAEEPGYTKISRVYKSHNVKFSNVLIDDNGISAENLRQSGVDIIHCSPSHHYPTGIVMSVSRRYSLLGWAAEKDERYIIEDDFDSEFRMAGKPLPTLQSIDATGKVIYINTFTKTLASTIRISYMVLPKELTGFFNKKLGFYSCTVSAFEQYTLARFISEGYFEKHINRMRNLYKKKRDRLIEVLLANLPSDFAKIREEEAGLHFILSLDTKTKDSEIVNIAENSGLKVACISQYYENSSDNSHSLIVNYSSIPDENIDEAAKRLADVLCNL